MSSENCLYLDVRIERDRMCPGGDLKRQGSGEWRRCRTAGFRGMMQVWSTGAVRRCRLVVVRGEILSAWAYVLRASLKVQSSFDIWDFVGFIPLAQGRLGR